MTEKEIYGVTLQLIMGPQRRSSGMFPAAAVQNPDDAAKLTTWYSLPVGVASARTVQLDVIATFAADSDTVIIQVERNGTTVNQTLTYDDFVTDNAAFVAGEHRTSLHLRGFGITGLRIGLSSTASSIFASAGPVA